MPITLDKLFSPTVESSFEILGETVHVTWKPWAYTGEMQDLAQRLGEEDRAEQAELDELRADPTQAGEVQRRDMLRSYRESGAIRTFLAALLDHWDVMDGRKPFGTDIASLMRLPDPFVRLVFVSLGVENTPDPTKAPTSDEPSSTGRSQGSARSRTGTTSSPRRASTGSRHGTSTNGHVGRGSTRSGAAGR